MGQKNALRQIIVAAVLGPILVGLVGCSASNTGVAAYERPQRDDDRVSADLVEGVTEELDLSSSRLVGETGDHRFYAVKYEADTGDRGSCLVIVQDSAPETATSGCSTALPIEVSLSGTSPVRARLGSFEGNETGGWSRITDDLFVQAPKS